MAWTWKNLNFHKDKRSTTPVINNNAVYILDLQILILDHFETVGIFLLCWFQSCTWFNLMLVFIVEPISMKLSDFFSVTVISYYVVSAGSAARSSVDCFTQFVSYIIVFIGIEIEETLDS